MPFLIDAHHIGARQTGNETWIRNISRELSGLARPGELAFAASEAGAARVESLTGGVPAHLSSSALRRLAFDIPRAAAEMRADALLLQYTMPLRTSAPCVVMVHDTSFEEPTAAEWMPRRTAMRIRWSVRASARRAARLLAPSRFTQECLARIYGIPLDRIVLVPNAVDPELARHIDALQDPPKTDEFRVLAVGNVLPRKNLRTLAEAVAAMRRQGASAALRVVGSVSEGAKNLEHEIRVLLGSAVSFTGYIDNAQLAVEYCAADVLGFPSLFEGFGIPAIEAMYAGTPVVVSDSTCLPEIVGDAGVSVNPNDVAAWTSALRRIRDDSGWAAELRVRGRRRAGEFNWTTSARAVLATLRDAASGSQK